MFPRHHLSRWTSRRFRLGFSLVLVGALLASLVAISTSTAMSVDEFPTSRNLAPLALSPGSPSYQTYAAPNGLGTNAGEPTLGVDYVTGKVMFQSGLDTLRVGFDDCSSPATATWESKPAPNAAVSLDPILHTDSTIFTKTVGGNPVQFCRTFTSQLLGKASASAFTDDDGETYTVTTGNSPIVSGVDHQTYGAGPYRPGSPAELINQASTTPFKHAVYYCSQDIAAANCTRSDDGGLTFNPAVPIYNLTQCVGLHGHVQVAPDGTVYVPNKSCVSAQGRRQGLTVSVDNGLTWSVRTVPDATVGDSDPAIGIGADGTVYFGYQSANTNGRAKIAVSRDRGLTWSPSIDVGAPLGVQNLVFPTVTAGDGDRAAFAFVGTTTGGNYQAAAFPGVWHMYVATTYDRGASWVTVDTTPNDPVQRGSICTGGTTCGNDRNLLDFNDIVYDREGRVLVGYADGCIGACVTSPPNSFASLGTIARQAGGKRLLAAFDPPASARPGAPLVTASTVNGGVRLEWQAPDDGGSPITGYNVYRREQGGTNMLLATVTTTNYVDTTTVANTDYFYQVTAINANGEGVACREVSPTLTGVVENPCVTPGKTVLVDPMGDQNATVGMPQQDIHSVAIAEPYIDATSTRLVFTLKVANLTTLPPNGTWQVSFNPVAGTTYFVQMDTDATSTPTFGYGMVDENGINQSLGDADAASAYTADGTITLVIDNSLVGNPVVGQTLTVVNGRTSTLIGAVGTGLTATVDSTGNGDYTLIGNAACRPNAAPIAALSAIPRTGVKPLTVDFNAGSSSDSDAGDTIASYVFDFGDGTQPVTTTSSMATHTYTVAGAYRAKLKVRDSRGKLNENVAETVIEVSEPTAGPDNDVLFDQLYHGANNTIPLTETVPGESYTFRTVDPSGNVFPTTAVDIYMLTAQGDLTSANVAFSTGGNDTFVPMTFVKSVTTDFRRVGQTAQTYDVYKGTIPAQAVGTNVFYRLQANDGTKSAYLKAVGDPDNPLGQNVRANDDFGDNYSYTVVAEPTALPTNTATSVPATSTGTVMPTNTLTSVPATTTATSVLSTQTSTATTSSGTTTPTATSQGSTSTPSTTATTVAGTAIPSTTATSGASTSTPSTTATAVVGTVLPSTTATTVIGTVLPSTTATSGASTSTPSTTATAVAGTAAPSTTATSGASTSTPTSSSTPGIGTTPTTSATAEAQTSIPTQTTLPGATQTATPSSPPVAPTSVVDSRSVIYLPVVVR